MRILFFTVFFSCIAFISFGQNQGKLEPIKPIKAEGEVIGTLEGMDNIAILKISKADTANAEFSIDNTEILCTFEFGTKPTNGDPKLEGIKKGDKVRVELYGSRQHEHEPWDYQVFRYWLIKETPSAAKGAKPQK